ncbi:VirB4-like conjugal transfer ATPase, CD1110 family [Faecalibaculum rodentium]|uniref:VirB4-like conjugal transfer ATPase, CD1110 family n=1 Tax=Faecalibaculum rodentium TaxID=1702221 RepID=UPI0023EFDFF6|nr:DUF87 domain-containing protein [Faecalibaculum rodentium]
MVWKKRKATEKSTNNTSQNTEKNLENAESKTESKRDAKKRIQRARSAQNVICYKTMMENGICVLDNDIYSKAVLFKDINYHIAPDDVKESLLAQYRQLLNSLGNDVDVSLVINNRLINREEFENNILMRMKGDGLDVIRSEMNQHPLDNMAKGNNSIVSEKMFVFSCREANYLDAEKTLNNLEKDFVNQLHNLGCDPQPMNGVERLKTIASITRPGKPFNFCYEDLGIKETTKDYVAPYSFEFKKDSFEMGDRHCCVMVLGNYPTYFGDNLIYELTQLESNIVITFHMQMKSKEQALTDINRTSAMVDIQVQDENRKSAKNMDFSGTLPPGLNQQVENVQIWRDSIEKGDERMFQTQLVVLVNAKSEDEMQAVKKDVERIGRRCGCDFFTMELEQEMGFNAVLPLGIPKEGLGRNLLTDNCTNVMPFTSQELLEERNPVFYGLNATTSNMILCNRRSLPNANGFILGKSGAGKSFRTKEEFTWTFLNDDNADIIIIDPQGEYSKVAELLNEHSNQPQCAVLEVSTTSNLHFNPFDGDITQPDFARRKAEFVQIMMAEMLGNGYLTPEQKSLVDQIVFKMYQEYEGHLAKKEYDEAFTPSLKVFYNYLGAMVDNPVAQNMHASLWTYVNGSYDLFAHHSNVDANARMLIYDISELGETIRTLGLKVVLESIRDQIIRNHAKGRRTLIYIDEIYLLLKDEYSENFLYEFWKWVRKFGGSCTGMTQNVSDMLRSQKGQAMLSNSEFYIILAQDQLDLVQLKSLLSLSEEQVRYVQTARRGAGLLRFGNTIIPYTDDFPRDTRCYQMWNTDPVKTQDQKSQDYYNRRKEAMDFKKARTQQREKKSILDLATVVKRAEQAEEEKAVSLKQPAETPLIKLVEAEPDPVVIPPREQSMESLRAEDY